MSFLMLQILTIFAVGAAAVDMNRCEQPAESLLDCRGVDADNYEYSENGNEITRINFLRLRGVVILQNLKSVNTITVETGNAQCHQLKKFIGSVTIQLSDTSIVCDVSM